MLSSIFLLELHALCCISQELGASHVKIQAEWAEVGHLQMFPPGLYVCQCSQLYCAWYL